MSGDDLRRTSFATGSTSFDPDVAVLAGGLSKEGRVPDGDIDRALQRKVAFEQDPVTHTFAMEL